jgi:hypothetical protein
VIDARHVAPDGAWLVLSSAGYKHPGSYGANACAFSYVELMLRETRPLPVPTFFSVPAKEILTPVQ